TTTITETPAPRAENAAPAVDLTESTPPSSPPGQEIKEEPSLLTSQQRAARNAEVALESILFPEGIPVELEDMVLPDHDDDGAQDPPQRGPLSPVVVLERLPRPEGPQSQPAREAPIYLQDYWDPAHPTVEIGSSSASSSSSSSSSCSSCSRCSSKSGNSTIRSPGPAGDPATPRPSEGEGPDSTPAPSIQSAATEFIDLGPLEELSLPSTVPAAESPPPALSHPENELATPHPPPTDPRAGEKTPPHPLLTPAGGRTAGPSSKPAETSTAKPPPVSTTSSARPRPVPRSPPRLHDRRAEKYWAPFERAPIRSAAAGPAYPFPREEERRPRQEDEPPEDSGLRFFWQPPATAPTSRRADYAPEQYGYYTSAAASAPPRPALGRGANARFGPPPPSQATRWSRETIEALRGILDQAQRSQQQSPERRYPPR
ncbi:vegetative cell wall protein gp1-like, partial [Fopius arisanus]|uniref:Vegetative cell wall protein gp1-like n=1 Tax=Fopius arisanus TaxID=64838 RepID=A0A9R1TQT8_9HYME